MGLFRRAASKVNQLDVATDLTLALSPSIRRVHKLEERGATANGVITGIKFSLDNDTVRKEFAITVLAGPDAGRYGVRTQPRQACRLRLGVPVVLKVDGRRGVIDWATMAEAWGLQGEYLTQDSLRKPPGDWIVDTALDARVQRHLRKWSPAAATIVELRRRSVMGMPTLNWDMELQLVDGTTAQVKGDEVPTYAQWYAAPGTVVPVVVDPNGSGQASIDWPKLAREQSGQVGFDDDPPPGSIAAEVEREGGGG